MQVHIHARYTSAIDTSFFLASATPLEDNGAMPFLIAIARNASLDTPDCTCLRNASFMTNSS